MSQVEMLGTEEYDTRFMEDEGLAGVDEKVPSSIEPEGLPELEAQPDYVGLARESLASQMGSSLGEATFTETHRTVIDSSGQLKELFNETKGEATKWLDKDGQPVDLVEALKNDSAAATEYQKMLDKLQSEKYTTRVNEQNSRQGTITAIERITILPDGSIEIISRVECFEIPEKADYEDEPATSGGSSSESGPTQTPEAVTSGKRTWFEQLSQTPPVEQSPLFSSNEPTKLSQATWGEQKQNLMALFPPSMTTIGPDGEITQSWSQVAEQAPQTSVMIAGPETPHGPQDIWRIDVSAAGIVTAEFHALPTPTESKLIVEPTWEIQETSPITPVSANPESSLPNEAVQVVDITPWVTQEGPTVNPDLPAPAPEDLLSSPTTESIMSTTEARQPSMSGLSSSEAVPSTLIVMTESVSASIEVIDISDPALSQEMRTSIIEPVPVLVEPTKHVPEQPQVDHTPEPIDSSTMFVIDTSTPSSVDHIQATVATSTSTEVINLGHSNVLPIETTELSVIETMSVSETAHEVLQQPGKETRLTPGIAVDIHAPQIQEKEPAVATAHEEQPAAIVEASQSMTEPVEMVTKKVSVPEKQTVISTSETATSAAQTVDRIVPIAKESEANYSLVAASEKPIVFEKVAVAITPESPQSSVVKTTQLTKETKQVIEPKSVETAVTSQGLASSEKVVINRNSQRVEVTVPASISVKEQPKSEVTAPRQESSYFSPTKVKAISSKVTRQPRHVSSMGTPKVLVAAKERPISHVVSHQPARPIVPSRFQRPRREATADQTIWAKSRPLTSGVTNRPKAPQLRTTNRRPRIERRSVVNHVPADVADDQVRQTRTTNRRRPAMTAQRYLS